MPVLATPIGAVLDPDPGPLSPIRVFTDGACEPNPGVGGWAWTVDQDRWAAGGARKATNNLMEFTAIREALRAVPGPVIIETDSQYALKAVTDWARRWQRNGWVTSGREPVKNRDLIEEILTECDNRWVRMLWVRGHNGHAGNERADRLAVAARQGLVSGRVVEGPGWFGERPEGTVITQARTGTARTRNRRTRRR